MKYKIVVFFHFTQGESNKGILCLQISDKYFFSHSDDDVSQDIDKHTFHIIDSNVSYNSHVLMFVVYHKTLNKFYLILFYPVCKETAG